MHPLTFGVEFEFAMAMVDDEELDPEPEDGRTVKGIYYAAPRCPSDPNIMINSWEIHEHLLSAIAIKLEEAGLPARASGVRGTKHDWELESSTWYVTTDTSLSAPKKVNDYSWETFEVTSPAYYFCPDSLRAVELALHTLNANFRLNSNDSCGLHVHVGNGNSSFDLRSIKDLMSFLWTFEPKIDQLHGRLRTINGESFCKSLRKHSKLVTNDVYYSSANTLVLEPPFAMPSIAARTLNAVPTILQARSLVDLRRMTHDNSHYMAYNIQYLREANHDPNKRTMEFRQHEATLKAERVVAWIQTVVGLLEFARGCEPAALMDLILTEAGRQDIHGLRGGMEITELLRLIGLDGPAQFYKEHPVHSYGQNPDEWDFDDFWDSHWNGGVFSVLRDA